MPSSSAIWDLRTRVAATAKLIDSALAIVRTFSCDKVATFLMPKRGTAAKA